MELKIKVRLLCAGNTAALTLALLKLAGIVSWSWVVVLAPAWIVYLLMLTLATIIVARVPKGRFGEMSDRMREMSDKRKAYRAELKEMSRAILREFVYHRKPKEQEPEPEQEQEKKD